MNCIIIDDEPLAIDVITSYCEALGSVNVLGTFTSGLEAIDFINKNKVDLILCDIEMPNINGIDLIKSLERKNSLVIFTTAYPKYALDGFDLNATDYLVKPIPFPRFIKAINRAKRIHQQNHSNTPNKLSSAGSVTIQSDDFIFVKSEYENLKLNIEDILYVQGLKDYLKIHLVNASPVLTLMNFNDIISKLPEKMFIRVHRSYIINVNKIDSIQKSKIIIKDVRVPIGNSYKSIVNSRFGL